MADFKLEKVDNTHANKIETKEVVTLIDIGQLQQQKGEIESEIAQKNQAHEDEIGRLTAQLAEINNVIDAFNQLP
jgi:hypothetical protein